MAVTRLLVWAIHDTAGFDTAWATLEDGRLRADGRAVGLRPQAAWIDYRLDTGDEFVTRAMDVEARWDGGTASLRLRNDDGAWTVNGEPRPDLDGALDCDLAACPLTNTMPILRHGLHREPGERELLMAFIRIPTLEVTPNRQRYTFLRRLADGGGQVRYTSGSFRSDLTVDDEGFVLDYPQLGRRVQPAAQPPPDVRSDGPSSPRPG
jgi:hypothetical protein